VVPQLGWYYSSMNAMRDAILELVQELPESQLPGALTDLQRRSSAAVRQSKSDPDYVPFSWVGMIKNGPTNASDPDYIDAALAEGFGRL
jgi:hypothetical protein